MDRDIKLQNLHLHCRACLSELAGNKHDVNEMARSLLKLFQKYAELKTTQSKLYPKSICDQCFGKLKSFDDFRNKIKESTEFLKELLKFQAEEPCESSDESEKSEDNQDSTNDSGKVDDDPLQWVQVKMEVNEADETLNIDMKNTNESENKEDSKSGKQKTSASKKIKNITKCRICDEAFNTGKALKIHMQVEHGGEPIFSCDQCDRGFNRETRLKLHKSEVHAENPVQIDCKFGCGKVFQRSRTADNHYRRKHMSSNVVLTGETETSELPKMEFANDNCESRLQEHRKDIHSENPEEFVCKFGCGKVFKTSDLASNHYRQQHSEKIVRSEKATCICEDCGRVFKCMTTLRQHSYQHRPIEERPFHCELCNKRFVFKKSYKEHLLRHKGIKDFECPQCGLKKATKQDLRNHMKYHTDELKVPCPLCKKIFGNPTNLRRHIQLVHKGVKNFKCRFCDEAFGKAETLKHHEMRHTGEKPHKCEICDKSFIQLVALRTHMKTHNMPPKLPKGNRPAETAIFEPTTLVNINERTLYN